MQNLLTLITLQKNARHKHKKTELEFLIVNQTFNLVPYRHCIYWGWNGETVTIVAASGLVQVDPHGPYAIWLSRVIKKILADKVLPHQNEIKEGQAESYIIQLPVTPADCEKQDAEEWKKWVSANAVMFAMKNDDGEVVRGVWVDREQPFNDAERAFLEDLFDGYAHSLSFFDTENTSDKVRGFWKSLFSLSKSNVKRVILVILLAMLIPVRMSVSAPAEIVARKPYVISVPFDGVIADVIVSPGQSVKKGDVLVRMDSTYLKNKSDMSAKERETAEIALNKTEREALGDRSKLAEIAILRSQVETKSAESDFADEMLERAEIRAERDGVVMFSDINALRGKPARTGEQIMLLADPQDSELMIRIPVDAMIKINQSVPATFFLNAMPLGFRKATYEDIGYQATQDPDGLMTYKVRARFEKDDMQPRVGWTGTGKVYGDYTIMAYNIFRRPMVTLRRKLGL